MISVSNNEDKFRDIKMLGLKRLLLFDLTKRKLYMLEKSRRAPTWFIDKNHGFFEQTAHGF
jgi:hypothetical protein